jgi:formylglycine-generating enzyme required for sulfatase activity
MSQGYVKTDGTNFYIRYDGGVAYLYADTGDPATDICIACCPKSSMSKWEDPNLVCNAAGLTHTRPLVNPYYYSDSILATPPSNEILSLLCGSPPQVNLSSRIEVIIPNDPIFSGTYVFDYLDFLPTPKWILNTVLTTTNISSSINTFPIGKNTANYNNIADWDSQDGNVSSVGTNGGPSAYGTYDQDGNVWEWNDLDATQSANKGKRGGAYDSTLADLGATTRYDNIIPSGKFNNLGFRIASSGNFLNLPEVRMVADLNNPNDITYGYGSVNYLYHIHKYPVTVNKWVNFLNTKAATDTYELYNSNMKINRSGSSGSYTYTAMANYGNKPITNVSWFGAARYCNWYHNGRSTGSTETGAYTLTGGINSGNAVAKNAGAKYYIPSENEWFKAAYYAGGTADSYYEFATQKGFFFGPSTISGVDVSGNGPYLTRNNTSNEYLINLTDTDDEVTYKGYVEVARSGDVNSNISGVYAFPSTFIFTAIQPPNDAVLYSAFGNSTGGSVGPFPTGTGHRAVVGFKLPIRWREAYNDFIVVDRIDINTVISGVANAPSGYATSRSGSSTIGLSGITNNPATYVLTDTTTAITGACTGIGYPGFAYKTSASGIPFNNTNYSINISGFNGSRPEFNKYSITKNSVSYDLNTTRLFDNKTGIEAIVNYVFSCRTSGTICNSFDNILNTNILPPSTGYTTISGSCFGSIVNADYACSSAIARPQQTYFDNLGQLTIRPIYSGVPQNYYPCVKNGSSSGNVYKAGSGQFISIDYNSTIAGGLVYDADIFRNWINNNFSFVTLDTSDPPNIIRKLPGVDIYWQAEVDNDQMLALLVPAQGLELSCPVIIVTTVNNISYWNTGWSPNEDRSEFTGNYIYDSLNNRYINSESSDQSIQIRFFDNKWNMGKVNGANFDVYYTLQYVSGGIPPEFLTSLSNMDTEDYNDYSGYGDISDQLTWGQSQLPVSCSTNPIGQWIAGPYGVGNAISIKSAYRLRYEGSTCCGSGPAYQFPT